MTISSIWKYDNTNFINIKLLYLYSKKQFSYKLCFPKRNDFQFEQYTSRDRVCFAKRKWFTLQSFLKFTPLTELSTNLYIFILKLNQPMRDESSQSRQSCDK